MQGLLFFLQLSVYIQKDQEREPRPSNLAIGGRCFCVYKENKCCIDITVSQSYVIQRKINHVYFSGKWGAALPAAKNEVRD